MAGRDVVRPSQIRTEQEVTVQCCFFIITVTGHNVPVSRLLLDLNVTQVNAGLRNGDTYTSNNYTGTRKGAPATPESLLRCAKRLPVVCEDILVRIRNIWRSQSIYNTTHNIAGFPTFTFSGMTTDDLSVKIDGSDVIPAAGKLNICISGARGEY